jgi:hypothetical protein
MSLYWTKVKRTIPLLIGSVAAAYAIGLAQASVVHADPCGGGGGGGGGWPGGGGYCDSAPYADGSYDHCINVRVLGFGGWQCNRVFPPAPGG